MLESPTPDLSQHSRQSVQTSWLLVGIIAATLIIFYVYQARLTSLAKTWLFNENYGHGLFVPLIAIYLAWGKKEQLQECYGSGSWMGLLVVILGLGFFITGQLGTLFIIQDISLWMIIVGLVLTIVGVRGTKALAFPLGLLLVTIPLPQFLFQGLTWQLRLISSTLGVGCLQLVGVTAFQDGNVIDLGPIQLQVVEACSGLRFLFPLMTLALLCAYFFKDRMWKRILLFLSSIPISIFLNGFRIGIIGILVDLWGRGAADGFLHFFEGWVVFVFGLGLLVLEMWILKRLWPVSPHDDEREAHSSSTRASPLASQMTQSTWPWAFVTALLSIVSLGTFAAQLEMREDIASPRRAFLDFPLTIGDWKGSTSALDQKFIDTLRFDDYILADYQRPENLHGPINLYVAYYRSQRSGQSIHSPKSCIPGGGWLITSSKTVRIDPSKQTATPIHVNEVVIEKDDSRQLVLYWFQQRHRVQTNEYLIKLYLLWDSLTQQRTDGALIRLTASIPSHGNETTIRKQLMQFAHSLQPILAPYIPSEM